MMSIALNMQAFLSSKFNELKIKRKDFVYGSGILESLLSGFLNANRINPTLHSVIKIADYFNCSVDEVLGRKKYIPYDYKIKRILYSEITNNLVLYLNHELEIRNVTANKLAKLCGIGENTILKSIKKGNIKGNLSTRSILAIADYFNVSIDEMIGRADKHHKPNK